MTFPARTYCLIKIHHIIFCQYPVPTPFIISPAPYIQHYTHYIVAISKASLQGVSHGLGGYNSVSKALLPLRASIALRGRYTDWAFWGSSFFIMDLAKRLKAAVPVTLSRRPASLAVRRALLTVRVQMVGGPLFRITKQFGGHFSQGH